jgi:predicted nuclease of predicted toxin-antitoxin system
MRILLDESLPVEVRSELSGHDVRTVREQGWSGLTNGELLERAADPFDVLLTADRNLQYQQNLNRLPVAVVVLTARTNRIEDLRPLTPRVLEVLSSLQPRTLAIVGA